MLAQSSSSFRPLEYRTTRQESLRSFFCSRSCSSPAGVSVRRNQRWLPLKSLKLQVSRTKIACRGQAIGDFDGIVIVDHGSRRRESNLMLNDFVAMFREKTGYKIVEPAHMELAEPSIKNAFGLCVEQGAKRVIVSPFFLFPGRHWQKDIPSLTADAAKEYPGVQYLVTAPLGLHEHLVDVVNDRIGYCLSHVEGRADECSVCAGTGKCRLYD